MYGQVMNIQGNLVEGVGMGVTREFTIRSLYVKIGIEYILNCINVKLCTAIFLKVFLLKIRHRST
jgi:hypothetical protein